MLIANPVETPLLYFLSRGIRLYPLIPSGSVRYDHFSEGITTPGELEDCQARGIRAFGFIPYSYDMAVIRMPGGKLSVIRRKLDSMGVVSLFAVNSPVFSTGPEGTITIFFTFLKESLKRIPANIRLAQGIDILSAALIPAPGSFCSTGKVVLHGDLETLPFFPLKLLSGRFDGK